MSPMPGRNGFQGIQSVARAMSILELFSDKRPSLSISEVAELHGLTNLRHYNPPMGFAKDLDAVEECLQFIESQSPFRFCFLAVGSPQQESLAALLQARGIARGMALCVGASMNFITGREKRAPQWMQQFALEWLFRLVQDPQRLAGRYLVRGPRFFGHLRRARYVPRKSAVEAG